MSVKEQATSSSNGTNENQLERNKDNLRVHISYEGIEKTLSGNVETVWVSLNRLFNGLLPSFDIAKKLALNVDLETLAKESQGMIGIAKEGPYVLVPRNKLTDNETLSLLLLAGYLAHHLGNAETSEVSKEELQSKLGKGPKIASTRLGELVKNQIATKTSNEKYCITTFGLAQLQKDIIPRIRSKAGI